MGVNCYEIASEDFFKSDWDRSICLFFFNRFQDNRQQCLQHHQTNIKFNSIPNKGMTLSEYVKKRNGVPIGHPKSLRNNLERSLGAKNFSAFWNFWNPIFGYFLATMVFKPLKKKIPASVSLILTFVFCGLIHDLVTTLIRGRVSLFFSVWFLLMGGAVVISKQINYDVSNKPWSFRAAANLLIIAICFFLTNRLNTILNFY